MNTGQTKLATWNSFSYICTRALHSSYLSRIVAQPIPSFLCYPRPPSHRPSSPTSVSFLPATHLLRWGGRMNKIEWWFIIVEWYEQKILDNKQPIGSDTIMRASNMIQVKNIKINTIVLKFKILLCFKNFIVNMLYFNYNNGKLSDISVVIIPYNKTLSVWCICLQFSWRFSKEN